MNAWEGGKGRLRVGGLVCVTVRRERKALVMSGC